MSQPETMESSAKKNERRIPPMICVTPPGRLVNRLLLLLDLLGVFPDLAAFLRKSSNELRSYVFRIKTSYINNRIGKHGVHSIDV